MDKSIFSELNAVNVNEYVEKKQKLTYLSWAMAWQEVKKRYPEATYTIKRYDDKPYVFDEDLGYMVFTEVTINDLTHEMWLPVMDGANKAMKNKAYTYQVKEYNYGKPTGNFIDKEVSAATMFDVNKTIMRCLTKNLAMFGLGLYIYQGEDLPEDPEETKPANNEFITFKQRQELMNLATAEHGEDKAAGAIMAMLEKLGVSKTDKIKTSQFETAKLLIGGKQ